LYGDIHYDHTFITLHLKIRLNMPV